jgi:hypothetical protein
MTTQQIRKDIQQLEIAIKVKEKENAAHQELLSKNGITDDASYKSWVADTDAKILELENEASKLLDVIEEVLDTVEEFYATNG